MSTSITSSTLGKKTYKIIFLGDSGTGKTSIIERFVNNQFEEKENVSMCLYSPPLASILWAKISPTKAPRADCSCGTLLVKSVLGVSFPHT